MKDKYARALLKDIIGVLDREIAYPDDTARTYTRGKGHDTDRLDKLGNRYDKIWDDLVALRIRVCDLEEAAKPTCKKCGQKVESVAKSVKRTGANDV